MMTYGQHCLRAALRLSAEWNGNGYVSEFDLVGAANHFAPVVNGG
jgi:hypothetical protein